MTSCDQETGSNPILAAYIDLLKTWSPSEEVLASVVDNLGDFNHLILSFWEPTGPVDVALAWSNGTFPSDALAKIHAAGAKVLVSAGGATVTPITDWIAGQGMDGASYGTAVATWANEQGLDGVDFDIEDDSYKTSPDQAVQWTVDAIKAAHATLNNKTVTLAPQAPYFDPGFGQGPFLKVDQQVGDLVSFYNIQFYNQAATTYDTYETLFVQSNGWSTDSAVQQIVDNGVPLSRIVVGKPLLASDASNTGWVSASDLGSWISKASQNSLGVAGAMTWQFHSDPETSAWSTTVRSGFGA